MKDYFLFHSCEWFMIVTNGTTFTRNTKEYWAYICLIRCLIIHKGKTITEERETQTSKNSGRAFRKNFQELRGQADRRG